MKGSKLIYSTIAHKVTIGVSGLLLCGFLATHLLGNLLIYAPADNFKAYNDYAHALHANPLLPIAEIGLLVLFVAHILITTLTVVRNSQARPVRYAVKRSKRGKTAAAAHNIMHLTGVVVLAFIVLHILDMRLGIRFPEVDGVSPAERALQVLHDPLSASLYTLGSLLLGYHVFHGFSSSFQTLGFNHPKYLPLVRRVGVAFAAIVALGFASFPIWANFIRK